MLDFLQELGRRNVIRVTIAYVMLAWIVAQVAELALDSFESPDWVIKTILLVLALGLPIAVFFAWAFELTPEGLKKEKDVDRTQSMTNRTGRKLDIAIIAMLGAALVAVVTDNYVLDRPEIESTPAQTQGVSIAVLPFVNMSSDKDQEYFSDGISEELLNLLAKIPEFQVAGRTSSFTFKGQNLDLKEIGHSLGVENILEGSVRKNGDRVRITAQLIKVSDGFHVWSETYDRTLDDIFAVQDDIAIKVVSALEVELLGGARNQPSSKFGIDNAAAYDAYLKGLFYYNRSGTDNLEKSVEHMQEAVTLAPESALAWAGLARALVGYAGQSDFDPADSLTRARSAVDKALALDPDLPEAHLAIANIKYSWDWDWVGTEAALERTLSLSPANLDAQLLRVNLYDTYGQLGQAEQLAREILARDPLNDRVPRALVSLLYNDSRFVEAAEMGERIVEADPNMPFIHSWLTVIYLQVGQSTLAIAHAQQEPVLYARYLALAVAHHAVGNIDKATAAQQQLLETYGDLAAYQQAELFAYWGQNNTALDWLETAYRQRDPGIVSVKSNIGLIALREHPRFVSILQKMNLAD
jgi:TolB-like protein/tetratricopeptide (TPR) repeat protein